MTDLKINLSSFSERFSENSFVFTITNKINFIYGKNGTGKSTIARSIKDQFFSIFNIYLFNGFEGIVGENNRLDAVALGTENTKIQKQINSVSKEIDEIREEIEKSEIKEDNLFSKLELVNNKLQKHEKTINDFYTNSARDIKNKKYDNVNIAITSYNKENFINEIPRAKLLNPQEITSYRDIIKSDEKIALKQLEFPNLNSSELFSSINIIIQSMVSQTVILNELENNSQKQNFARDGMQIHEH